MCSRDSCNTPIDHVFTPLPRYLHKLTIAAVNLEGPDGSVGPVLTQMAQQTNEQPKSIGRLGFAIEDASDYPGGIDDVRNTVGYSGRWGAIVALPNCTSAWEDALSSGDASYDPTGCLAVFYSSGRFYRWSQFNAPHSCDI